MVVWKSRSTTFWAVGTRVLALSCLVGLGAGVPATGWADEADDARAQVEKAKLTAESFAADKNLDDSWRELIGRAKGLLVVPQIVRAGFIFGASGGSAVLLARDESTGKWTDPAFYGIGGVSFGFQAGVDSAESLIIVRTERALTGLLKSEFKLGGDMSVSAGPAGGGVAAGSIVADLVIVSRSKGLYGGVSLSGSLVKIQGKRNRAYYGKEVSPTDILVRRAVTNPHAEGLIAAVTKLAGGM